MSMVFEEEHEREKHCLGHREVSYFSLSRMVFSSSLHWMYKMFETMSLSLKTSHNSGDEWYQAIRSRSDYLNYLQDEQSVCRDT